MIVSLGDYSAEVLQAMAEQVALGLELVGQAAEGYAKTDCPVDTGLLRNSITYALAGENAAIGSYTSDTGAKSGTYSGNTPKQDNEHSVYIGSNVEYAPSVELLDKTHKTGKAHFLRDAVTQHTDEYEDIIKNALKS